MNSLNSMLTNLVNDEKIDIKEEMFEKNVSNWVTECRYRMINFSMQKFLFNVMILYFSRSKLYFICDKFFWIIAYLFDILIFDCEETVKKFSTNTIEILRRFELTYATIRELSRLLMLIVKFAILRILKSNLEQMIQIFVVDFFVNIVDREVNKNSISFKSLSIDLTTDWKSVTTFFILNAFDSILRSSLF